RMDWKKELIMAFEQTVVVLIVLTLWLLIRLSRK
ncbi:MAG: hypothetical protein RLZZ69_3634, partial [Cyanobacteriota bacterium]